MNVRQRRVVMAIDEDQPMRAGESERVYLRRTHAVGRYRAHESTLLNARDIRVFPILVTRHRKTQLSETIERFAASVAQPRQPCASELRFKPLELIAIMGMQRYVHLGDHADSATDADANVSASKQP